MIKQHSYTVLHENAYNMLSSSISRPTGEYVDVKDNNGNTISVEIYYGGFVYAGEREISGQKWIALLGCGTKDAFDEARTSLLNITQQTGHLLGLEIITSNSDEDILNNFPSEEEIVKYNTWLNSFGFNSVAPKTYHEIIEEIFSYFAPDFQVGQIALN